MCKSFTNKCTACENPIFMQILNNLDWPKQPGTRICSSLIRTFWSTLFSSVIRIISASVWEVAAHSNMYLKTPAKYAVMQPWLFTFPSSHFHGLSSSNMRSISTPYTNHKHWSASGVHLKSNSVVDAVSESWVLKTSVFMSQCEGLL